MLTIFGAGGHCTEILQALGGFTLSIPNRFVVDTEEQRGAAPKGRTPIFLASEITDDSDYGIAAIGDPHHRQAIVAKWARRIGHWLDVHDNFARTVNNREGFHGLYFAAHSYVDRSAVLGDHVHVNRGAMVSHDCVVGEFCHIAPGAQLLGACRVGALTEIGANAVILPRVSVGEGCRIGAGAVVTRDVLSGFIARGNPVRVIEPFGEHP